jgi:bacteriorhodopsin
MKKLLLRLFAAESFRNARSLASKPPYSNHLNWNPIYYLRAGSSIGANSTTTINYVEINVTISQNRTPEASGSESNTTIVDEANYLEPDRFLKPDGYAPKIFWFCFSYFTFLAVAMYLFSVRKSSERKEPFVAGHTLAASTACTAACYFFMALGEGRLHEAYAIQVAPGIVAAPGDLLYRPVHPPTFWVRHVDWAISTSLALLLLAALAGTPRRPTPGRAPRAVPLPFLVSAVGLNLCVHVLGLAGTLAPRVELSKWTYWVLGLFVFAALLRQLAAPAGALARAAARNGRAAEARTVLRFVVGSWCVYPVLWAVCDGRCAPAAPRPAPRAPRPPPPRPLSSPTSHHAPHFALAALPPAAHGARALKPSGRLGWPGGRGGAARRWGRTSGRRSTGWRTW